jgi:hypothetical protein
VTAVKIDGERKEIFTSAAEPVVRELLARDSLLSDLEVLSLGLEDAFLSLIQSGEAA